MTAPVAPVTDRPDSPAPLGPGPTPIQEAINRAREAVAAAAAAPPATPPVETPPAAPAPVADPAAPPAEAPPEGEPTPEGEEAPPTEEAPPIEAKMVEIPARRPGEKPLLLEVEDQEVAERLRQMSNSGMRREEFRTAMSAVEAQRQELDLLEQHLQIDPVGFLIERVRPEVQVGLAMHLLSIPAVYETVVREIEEWQMDPNVQARRQAELRTERAEGRQSADQQLATLQAVREAGRVIKSTVDAITPADLPEDEATMFRDDCLLDVATYARSHPELTRLRPDDVIGIVERRLRHYGIDPKLAQAALSSGQPFRRPSAARPTGAPAPSATDAEAARTAGAKLAQASAVRRAAAAVPAAGAGARPARFEPVPQQGVKERIADLRKQLLGR